MLDPALLRPGRFDREIVIDLPDLTGRKGILKVHAAKVKMAENVDLHVIARGTPGFSGAELAALVNESALLATMKGKAAVELDDMEEARDKVRWGRQKKSRVMDEEDRLITAYHESGHALVAHLLPEVEPLHKVTIIPRGMALGATMQLPEKDRYHHRRKELYGGEAETTNNRMELKAAIEALNALNGSRSVLLYTDSRYVMDGINDWMPNWKKRGWKTASKKPVKNQDLWQALDEAISRHEIDWRWVRGHTGVPGNEDADRLANQGIDEL